MRNRLKPLGTCVAGACLLLTMASPAGAATPPASAPAVESRASAVVPQAFFWYTVRSDWFHEEGTCEQFGAGYVARNPYAHAYHCYRNPGQSRWSVDSWMYV